MNWQRRARQIAARSTAETRTHCKEQTISSCCAAEPKPVAVVTAVGKRGPCQIPATMGNEASRGRSFDRYEAHPARWSIAVPCGVDILARLAAVQPPHIFTAFS